MRNIHQSPGYPHSTQVRRTCCQEDELARLETPQEVSHEPFTPAVNSEVSCKYSVHGRFLPGIPKSAATEANATVEILSDNRIIVAEISPSGISIFLCLFSWASRWTLHDSSGSDNFHAKSFASYRSPYTQFTSFAVRNELTSCLTWQVAQPSSASSSHALESPTLTAVNTSIPNFQGTSQFSITPQTRRC
ncbi:hypothetical protein RRG08_035065 [Elysia crispata]|uniref:Uncharacterized protein n=1 Tax=Elysia crispata TaxID=231223 RepID=A0AAE0ZSM4_9GAST|nr:hypothetical protein RRG08_035065 [Elysia crispata]